MYSGTHFTGRLGASQCSGLVAAGKRHSITISYSHANPDTDSDTHANSHAAAFRRRHLRGRMEFHPGLLQHCDHQLQWRLHGQQGWQKLYRTVLEYESGPNRAASANTAAGHPPDGSSVRAHS